MNESKLYGTRVICQTFSLKPFFHQKLRKLSILQRFTSSKDTKIRLEKLFNAIMLSLYVHPKLIKKSPVSI